MLRIQLQADEAAVFWERSRQPDSAVAAKRSNLQDSAGLHQACEYLQQLALIRGYRDRGEFRLDARFDCCIESRVREYDGLTYVIVDCSPLLLIHAFISTQKIFDSEFAGLFLLTF